MDSVKCILLRSNDVMHSKNLLTSNQKVAIRQETEKQRNHGDETRLQVLFE